MEFDGISDKMLLNAFAVTTDGLRRAYGLEIVNKFAGTLVVLDPLVRPSNYDPSKVSLEEASGAVRFMRRVVEDHPDAAKFDKIALTKARDLWVLMQILGPNISGLDIQQKYPLLYRPGMTKWHGAVVAHGVPIAFSGVQGHYDHATAEMFGAWLAAMCRQAVADEVMADESAFIAGREPRDTPFTLLQPSFPGHSVAHDLG